VRLQVSLARANPITFLKTIGPLYIIFLVTVLTFFVTAIDDNTFRGGLATLGATLFAVIVNMQRADGVVSTGGVTLHILTPLWILFAMAATFIAWRWASAATRWRESNGSITPASCTARSPMSRSPRALIAIGAGNRCRQAPSALP
jgi:hypothetical protein